MSVALMPPLDLEPPSVAGRRGSLARFWPKSRRAPAAPVKPAWRETLARFWPRSRKPSAPVSRRKLRPGARPRSLGRAGLTDRERRRLAKDEAKVRPIRRVRPRLWRDCQEGRAPCPWVSCSMHLYLDVDPETGIIKLNFPDRQPHQLAETCALRVVRDRGAISHEEVGKLVNLTGMGVLQIEKKALGTMGPALADVDESLGSDEGGRSWDR